ncbi:hypothetical protein R3P38DRAFT_2810423 [Favolaschia claudopus]|uniref:Uncharacterized protein n=1 Tax=Favolaschia claudopus TaxID=2862362 RepID=A0AAV9ZB68_9AGAR
MRSGRPEYRDEILVPSPACWLPRRRDWPRGAQYPLHQSERRRRDVAEDNNVEADEGRELGEAFCEVVEPLADYVVRDHLTEAINKYWRYGSGSRKYAQPVPSPGSRRSLAFSSNRKVEAHLVSAGASSQLLGKFTPGRGQAGHLIANLSWVAASQRLRRSWVHGCPNSHSRLHPQNATATSWMPFKSRTTKFMCPAFGRGQDGPSWMSKPIALREPETRIAYLDNVERIPEMIQNAAVLAVKETVVALTAPDGGSLSVAPRASVIRRVATAI